jgi:hypothetical protein
MDPAGRVEERRRAMSGSASTESMRRLDNLRYDSDLGRPGSRERHPTLDYIDYMSEEVEAEEDDVSGGELSGVDSQEGPLHNGRSERQHHSFTLMCPARITRTRTWQCMMRAWKMCLSNK